MRADKIVLWGNAGDQPRDNAHTWDNSHGIEKDNTQGIEKDNTHGIAKDNAHTRDSKG